MLRAVWWNTAAFLKAFHQKCRGTTAKLVEQPLFEEKTWAETHTFFDVDKKTGGTANGPKHLQNKTYFLYVLHGQKKGGGTPLFCFVRAQTPARPPEQNDWGDSKKAEPYIRHKDVQRTPWILPCCVRFEEDDCAQYE